MADLLLELFSEEIPARMQAKASADLERMVTAGLKEQGLSFDAAQSFATPRRLCLHITGLPTSQPDTREERRGPRADAPEKAVAGFLSSTGLTRDQLEERETPKGSFLFAVMEKSGQPTTSVIATLIPKVITTFPWPKSMRWGDKELRWVRPLHSIICLLDNVVVMFDAGGIRSGEKTRGHRFHAPAQFHVSSFDDYVAQLRDAYVILDPLERQTDIRDGAIELAQSEGLTLVPDSGLLAENAGLTEWPVPLMGDFDESFLAVPPEVLTATMRKNQKYFTLNNEDGSMANRFICVANLKASDGGDAIIDGNERVLSARLADAKFFWDQDQKAKLEDWLPKLDNIIFHEKMGSVGDKVQRITALARYLAPFCKADADKAARAAKLAKTDLVSGMVGEFPEVQGIMGGYYAREQGEDDDVAQAIAAHYSPQGPGDDCPTDPVSVAVALADKIDTLVGFFGIDEKPTGSKDPYALRRAALSVIRLITENNLRCNLFDIFRHAWKAFETHNVALGEHEVALLDFFADRLKVQQREQGVPHDMIDAVFSLGGEDDLVRLLARVAALQDFLKSEDGTNLLAGYRRAANIVRIESKKDGTAFDGDVDPALLTEAPEKLLYEKLSAAKGEVAAAVEVEDFAAAMAALAKLRTPVDAFFEDVTVNADDIALRKNRLNLLNDIRRAVHNVADFAKIQG